MMHRRTKITEDKQSLVVYINMHGIISSNHWIVIECNITKNTQKPPFLELYE